MDWTGSGWRVNLQNFGSYSPAFQLQKPSCVRGIWLPFYHYHIVWGYYSGHLFLFTLTCVPPHTHTANNSGHQRNLLPRVVLLFFTQEGLSPDFSSDTQVNSIC